MLNKKLSVLIIARNEEKKLDNCINSIGEVDEIVLLLDRTTDESEKIAKKYNVKIVKGEWEIEGIRRNTGIKHCKRWFLFAIVQDTPEAGVQEQSTQDR